MAEQQMSREELTDARTRLLRQIEILRTPVRSSTPHSREMLATLKIILKEIDDELAERE